ncbi:MAG: hypothetical protein HZA19_04080 [Nitrospirae bacterium]|nr:hypothetical protein [Nitrospirota bacterium]
MCDNANNHSHAHGVRSDAEKTLADLREDLTEALKAVTKYESQRAVMSTADFPAVGEVIHTLGHLMEDQKRHVAELMQLITKIDMVQKKMLDGNGNGAHQDHGHGHEHDEHEEEHAHGHGH